MKRMLYIALAALLAMLSFSSLALTGAQGLLSAGKGEQQPAILVVSFGTSYNDTRETTIGAIEKEIKEAFPDHDVRRAFTSQTIIDKLEKRDNEKIDNVREAMERLVSDGVKEVVIQPTHVMNGYEYDDLVAEASAYSSKFNSFAIGAPLLSSSEDYGKVVAALEKEYGGRKDDCAIVMVGHGTEHYANAAYAALNFAFIDAGDNSAFVGTVEGWPALDDVLRYLRKGGYKTVKLMPFMIVAGDHATNDILGEEDGSWLVELEKAGFSVEGIKKGLGEYPGLRAIFVEHVNDAINASKAAK